MNPWFRIFVVFISVSLLIIILKRVDINEFLDNFLNLNIIYYIIGILLILSTMFLFAYRWRLTLQKDAEISYRSLLYRIVTSYFFNNLFLGVFGGDIYKALRIHKSTGKFAALFSVAYNRIVNTYSSAVLPIFMIYFVIERSSENLFVYYSLIASGVFLIFFILIVAFQRPVTDFIASRFKKAEKIILLNDISLLKTMLISLIIQFINITAHYMFAAALGIDIAFFDLAFLYSASAVIISIPVSINGIGVREGVFIFAFGFWGISAESALAFSFMSFTGTIVLSLIGGSIFVAENIIRAKIGK
jgi:glycosyltransferase 2 family protein